MKGYAYLKTLRKVLHITQQNIAEKIGCTKGNYSKMESGDIPFPLSKAHDVAQIVNAELSALGLKSMSMDTIFFTVVVPDMEQKEV